MSGRCSECNASTAWDDDAGSNICTSCGTLTDPSQSILDSHIPAPESTNNFNDITAIWDSTVSTTLKSYRGFHGGNWDLAGQGKEARDRKNAFAMAEFIKSLAMSFNAPGLSPRAETLFNQARAASKFRWGRKAALVAGACLSLALRESSRPDSLRDIAFLLNEPYPSLKRCFTSVISLLNLKLAAVDPSSYISTFQSHLTSVLDDHQKSSLPSTLVKNLNSTCLRAAAATADSLSDLIVRLGPDSLFGQLPVPPTACAIYILALEAEQRAPLKNVGELAQFLGKKCHFGKDVIMARYKSIQDLIASLAERVPWLTQYERKKGRASVSKRTVVARGLKDVLVFHDKVWRETAKPQIALDASDEEASCAPPIKRRKIQHPYTDATRFLLDPLSASLPPSNVPKHLYHKPRSDSEDYLPSDFSAAPVTPVDLPLTSYILSAPLPSLSAKRPPTRLQLLSVQRGGAGPDDIGDGELFEEGELEGLLRNEEEVHVVRQAMNWDVGTDSEGEEEAPPPVRKKRKLGDGEVEIKTSRLDMAALAEFLQDKDDEDSAQFVGLEEAKFGSDGTLLEECKDDEEYDSDGSIGPSSHAIGRVEGPDEDEVVVEEWRPLSPGLTGDTTWYPEEYD